jgi:hypothetical protein
MHENLSMHIIMHSLSDIIQPLLTVGCSIRNFIFANDFPILNVQFIRDGKNVTNGGCYTIRYIFNSGDINHYHV